MEGSSATASVDVSDDPPSLDIAASSISYTHRLLLSRYVRNALVNKKRSIPAHNQKLAMLLADETAAGLLRSAGFELDATGARFVAPLSADARMEAVLEAIERSLPSLIALPDEVLLRIFMLLSAEDLSALQRVSTPAARVARVGPLWLRFCPPRFWREARGQDRLGIEQWAAAAPIGFATAPPNGSHSNATSITTHASPSRAREEEVAIDWQLVYRITALWERLRARCSSDIAFTLRGGLSVGQLSGSTHAALLKRLPAAFVASLLVHDGQLDQQMAIGLLFGGTRLLSLDEIAAVAAEAPPMSGDVLQVSSLVGFQCLGLRTSDGAIVLRSGFNEHVVAKNWALFLERVLSDTI